MSEGRVYIPCYCDSGSEGAEEANEYIFASIDGRAESHLKCDSTYVYLSLVNSRLFGI
jgi:hypothetical protein